MGIKITTQFFGTFEGKEVKKYTITREEEMQVSIINYGATLTNLLVVDRNGERTDVVLGFETIDGYIQAGRFYIGGICGRFANRIANGQFKLNGTSYQLPINAGENSLHGGVKGFDKVYWDAEILPEADGVKFTYQSLDKEEGFPGNLKVSVIYRVKENSLILEYEGVTDKVTPINLTNHSYFNLSGSDEKNIFNHLLRINAKQVIEVNDELMPTGNLIDISNTDFDFTGFIDLGNKLGVVKNFDSTWVLSDKENKLIKAATLLHKKRGIQMDVFTDQPGIHFYSGHFLDGNMIATKKGKEYGKYAGLCLETQHFADSPNQKNFPSTLLNPGEIYSRKTIFSFSTFADH